MTTLIGFTSSLLRPGLQAKLASHGSSSRQRWYDISAFYFRIGSGKFCVYLKTANSIRNDSRNCFEHESNWVPHARLGSVLQIVRRRRDAESLHLVKQRGALQSESRGCSPRTSELPVGSLTRSENLLTDFVLQRWI